ncbi:carboxymuconolactone decarboxylase family protein [Microbacterium sp. AZCO]|uniref:carboxymuconolactone decarboxylase family protein n=1 Tax=Microbacterium sp. AZCO TaxID=3142976 RepID=UPI0031F4233C
MDHIECLRRLVINDGAAIRGAEFSTTLDARTLAAVRIAALVAIGGGELSYGAEVDAAIAAGSSPSEVVDIARAVAPIAGVPRVVSAAPRLAIALGCEDELFAGDVL